MLKRKKYSVGIDFGSSYIKIIRLSYDGDFISLDRMICVKTPPEALSDGVIQNPELLSTVLNSILAENGIKTKMASLSICFGPDTALIKWMEFPAFNRKELEMAIINKLEDEFKVPQVNIYYNWCKIADTKTDGQSISEVVVVGAMKGVVDNAVRTLKLSKIKPYFMEVDCYSIMRALNIKDNINTVVVNIGSSKTNLFAIANQEMNYCRNLDYNASSLLETLSTFLGYEMERSEEELIENGIICPFDVAVSFKQEPIREIIQPQVDRLVDEIVQTIEYYQEQYGYTVEHLVFCGGGAKINGLISYVEEKVGIPCNIGVPYFNNTLPTKQREALASDWASYLVAAGLALKEVQDNA